MPPSHFHETRWSMVTRAGGSDDAQARAALAWLTERYWEPLRRAALRWRCPADDVDDLVQDFCCRLVERRLDLGRVAPAGGRFRAWLLVVFRNFHRDRAAKARACKRGGGAVHVEARLADPAAPAEADAGFDRDWAEALLERAVDRLAAARALPAERLHFLHLRPFLTANGSSAAYAQTGFVLGLSEGAVKVAVHRLRQELRAMARLEILETLDDPTPATVDDELRTLAEALAGVIR